LISLALFLIAFSVLLLILLLCSEGWAWLSYRLYSSRCMAVVREETPFTLNHSKGTVEKMAEDGTFHRLPFSEDRNVGQLPFYYLLFEKNRVQYVFEWEAEGARWRGHYRYLKKKNFLTVGEEIELHYLNGKPWRYAVKDPALWHQLGIKLLIYIGLLAVGIALLASAIG